MIAPTFSDPDLQGRFAKDGFVVLALLGLPEVEAARRCRAELGPAPGDDRRGFYQDTFSDDCDHKARVDAALRAVLRPALDGLLFDHVPIVSTFLVAWPGSTGVVAHRDISIVDERMFRSVMVWCPLVSLGTGHGRLFAIPGSHRDAPPVRPHRSAGLQDRRSHADLVAAGCRPIDVAVGDAIVFDQAVLHGSEPHHGPEPRLIVGSALRPAASAMQFATEGPDGDARVDMVADDHFLHRRLDRHLGA